MPHLAGVVAVEVPDGGGEAEDGDEGSGDAQLREQDGVHFAHEPGADDLVGEGGAEALGQDDGVDGAARLRVYIGRLPAGVFPGAAHGRCGTRGRERSRWNSYTQG